MANDSAQTIINGLTAEQLTLTRHSVVTTADDAAAQRLATALRVSPRIGNVWVFACYILLAFAGSQMVLAAKQMVHGAAREVGADVIAIRHVTPAAVQIALALPSLTWSQIGVDDVAAGDNVSAPAAAAAAAAADDSDDDDDDDDDMVDFMAVAAGADVHALFAAVPDTKGNMATHLLVRMPPNTTAQMQQLASTVFATDPNIVLVRVHEAYLHVQLSIPVRCSTAITAQRQTCHDAVMVRAVNGTSWNKLMRSGVVNWTQELKRQVMVQLAEQRDGYLSVVKNGRIYQHGAGRVFEHLLGSMKSHSKTREGDAAVFGVPAVTTEFVQALIRLASTADDAGVIVCSCCEVCHEELQLCGPYGISADRQDDSQGYGAAGNMRFLSKRCNVPVKPNAAMILRTARTKTWLTGTSNNCYNRTSKRMVKLAKKQEPTADDVIVLTQWQQQSGDGGPLSVQGIRATMQQLKVASGGECARTDCRRPGEPLGFGDESRDGKLVYTRDPLQASPDRINNMGHYVSDNVRMVHQCCQPMEPHRGRQDVLNSLLGVLPLRWPDGLPKEVQTWCVRRMAEYGWTPVNENTRARAAAGDFEALMYLSIVERAIVLKPEIDAKKAEKKKKKRKRESNA